MEMKFFEKVDRNNSLFPTLESLAWGGPGYKEDLVPLGNIHILCGPNKHDQEQSVEAKGERVCSNSIPYLRVRTVQKGKVVSSPSLDICKQGWMLSMGTGWVGRLTQWTTELLTRPCSCESSHRHPNYPSTLKPRALRSRLGSHSLTKVEAYRGLRPS